MTQHATIIGAGLAGTLLARLLAMRGWRVDVFEKRHDPRVRGYAGGRSINLALAERGLAALRAAGLADEVLKQAIMMRGRMVHAHDGETNLQRYGLDDSEVIWSVSRGGLNELLLTAAEQAGARIHFGQKLRDIDYDHMQLDFTGMGVADGQIRNADFVIAADGAGSVVRRTLLAYTDLGEVVEDTMHGYKELEIPPAEDGGFRIEPNALHIWPRGQFMCIALPNAEGTFTVTLFMPKSSHGTKVPSFDEVVTAKQAAKMFHKEFPSAVPLMPSLIEDYVNNPMGMLATLRLKRWYLDKRVVLMGDAAHAMVPFHGQGMNCAFEDCTALERAMSKHDDRAQAFAAFEAERQPNATAIQDMALENYIEMRDRVDDADYLLLRELGAKLTAAAPDQFMSRYRMVTFNTMPYVEAYARGERQKAIMKQAIKGKQSVTDEMVQQVLGRLAVT